MKYPEVTNVQGTGIGWNGWRCDPAVTPCSGWASVVRSAWSNTMAWSICLSRAMNADAAQYMERGIGIERFRVVKDIENQGGSSSTAIADDIETGNK